MSTVPVVPAKVAGFQNFLEKFGTVLEKILNAGDNIALQEEAVITPLLPPTIAAAFVSVVSLVGKQLAASEKAIAATSTTSNTVLRDAQVAAIVGEAAISIFAQEGVTLAAGNVLPLVTALGTVLSTLKLTGITATPVG